MNSKVANSEARGVGPELDSTDPVSLSVSHYLQAMGTQRRDLKERKNTINFVFFLIISIFIKLFMCIDVGACVPVEVRT